MTLAGILGLLFLAWFVVVLYRVLTQFRFARGAGGIMAGISCGRPGEPRRLAVVLRDQDSWAEWLVRSRIAAAAGREPGLRVVLVDGGSADDTPLILERLARRFNMGFCRVEELGGRCARAAENEKPRAGETAGASVIHCPGPCFEAAGMGGEGPGQKCVVCHGYGSFNTTVPESRRTRYHGDGPPETDLRS